MLIDTENIPITLQAPKAEPAPPVISFQPISKKWKIFIGLLLGINTIVFFYTAYMYYIFHDKLASLSLAIQSNPLSVFISLLGLLVNISLLFVYVYFRKRQQQERVDIPTSNFWKILFVVLPLVYLFLAGMLIVLSGGIVLGLSVITDTIVATYNIIILLIYFDRHRPRKVFYAIGTIVIYLSLVFIIIGILLQILSTISFFTRGN